MYLNRLRGGATAPANEHRTPRRRLAIRRRVAAIAAEWHCMSGERDRSPIAPQETSGRPPRRHIRCRSRNRSSNRQAEDPASNAPSPPSVGRRLVRAGAIVTTPIPQSRDAPTSPLTSIATKHGWGETRQGSGLGGGLRRFLLWPTREGLGTLGDQPASLMTLTLERQWEGGPEIARGTAVAVRNRQKMIFQASISRLMNGEPFSSAWLGLTCGAAEVSTLPRSRWSLEIVEEPLRKALKIYHQNECDVGVLLHQASSCMRPIARRLRKKCALWHGRIGEQVVWLNHVLLSPHRCCCSQICEDTRSPLP